MKRLTGISAATLAGLLITSNAIADTKGQNQCDFTANLLQSNGYSAQSTYTSDSVKQILSSINLDSSNLNLSNNQNYRIAYNCNVTNNVATAALKVVPLDATQKTTTIKWTMTKSYYQ